MELTNKEPKHKGWVVTREDIGRELGDPNWVDWANKEIKSLQEQLAEEKKVSDGLHQAVLMGGNRQKELEDQNKKLVNFLLDPMLPTDDYPDVIRFNRPVYNIIFDELLKKGI